MPTDLLRPIDRLASDWRAQCRLPAARTALAALAAREPDVAAVDAEDLGELVSWLTAPGLRSPRSAEAPLEHRRVHAARVLRAMLRSAPEHPLIARGIVQALVPGLVGVARRLDWGGGGEWRDPDAFFVDLVSTTWEVVEEWSGQDRPYAVLDLLSAVRCRVRRRLLRHRAQEASQPTVGDVERPDVEPGRPLWAGGADTDIDALARAIEGERGGRLDARGAAILYGQCVLGFSLVELSGMTGRSSGFLRRHGERAARVITG